MNWAGHCLYWTAAAETADEAAPAAAGEETAADTVQAVAAPDFLGAVPAAVAVRSHAADAVQAAVAAVEAVPAVPAADVVPAVDDAPSG